MSGRVARVAAVSALVVVAAVLVTLTLRRPTLPGFAPTPIPPSPRDAGRVLTGPVVYTVDATTPDTWRYFSFRYGAVVDGAGASVWDLGFRRFQIIANGGARFAGGAGVVDLGPVAFDDVRTVPAAGYQLTDGGEDPRNAAIAGWYRYGFLSHALTPKPHVWAIRTADGRYAKLQLLSYYCAGAEPGCVTFRYVYQGDGSTAVQPAR